MLHVRSLLVDDEQHSASVTAEFHSSASDDELTSDCHVQHVSSCSVGARDTLTADSSDVLAVST